MKTLKEREDEDMKTSKAREIEHNTFMQIAKNVLYIRYCCVIIAGVQLGYITHCWYIGVFGTMHEDHRFGSNEVRIIDHETYG